MTIYLLARLVKLTIQEKHKEMTLKYCSLVWFLAANGTNSLKFLTNIAPRVYTEQVWFSQVIQLRWQLIRNQLINRWEVLHQEVKIRWRCQGTYENTLINRFINHSSSSSRSCPKWGGYSVYPRTTISKDSCFFLKLPTFHKQQRQQLPSTASVIKPIIKNSLIISF